MKNPVILLLNDIHASKDNLSEFTANWNEALSVCKERGISEIAVGGDMFQSRVAQTLDVLLAVSDALLRAAQAGVLVTLAEGNHDKVDQESLRGYNHIFARHSNVVVVDDFLTLYNPEWDFVLHMMSYFPENGSFTDRLNALVKGGMADGKRNFLYIHQGINGALANPAEDELPAHIFSPFDKVFVGHYHNRATIKGTAIEYIGSSRQFNFGEDIDKGYTVLYANGSHEFIRNEVNARYHVIDVQTEDVSVHLYDRIDEMKSDPRNRLKVRVHGSEAALAAVDKKRLMEAGAGKVEIVGEEVEVAEAPETGMLEKFDSRRIRESYEDFCSQKSIENPSLGLSYLSKIDASCGS
jgi:exonuclease SbcD